MSWPMVALGEVAEFNPRLPKTTPDDMPVSFLPMAAVSEDGAITYSEDRKIADVRKGYTHFRRGDVLLAKITPCFENGKATRTADLTTEVGAGSTEFHVIRASDRLDPSYAFHMLWNDRFRADAAGKMTGSAGQRRVPVDVVKSRAIPLPPLLEQRRIAGILDAADALRRRRRRAIETLDTLQGALFAEMFGTPADDRHGFGIGKIGDFLDDVRYGTSKKAGAEGRFPILRMGNVTAKGALDLRDLKWIDLDDRDIPKHTVRRGDILFNRTNSADLVGKTALVTTDETFAFAGYLVRARVNESNRAEYIAGYLNSPHGKAVLRNMAKNIVGMANINAKEMQRIPILKAPLHLQDRYAEAVQAFAGKRTAMTAHLAHLDALFATLQSRAFAGEL